MCTVLSSSGVIVCLLAVIYAVDTRLVCEFVSATSLCCTLWNVYVVQRKNIKSEHDNNERHTFIRTGRPERDKLITILTRHHGL